MKFTLLSDAYNFGKLTTHKVLKQCKNSEICDLYKATALKAKSKLTLFFIKKTEKAEKQIGQQKS